MLDLPSGDDDCEEIVMKAIEILQYVAYKLSYNAPSVVDIDIGTKSNKKNDNQTITMVWNISIRKTLKVTLTLAEIHILCTEYSEQNTILNVIKSESFTQKDQSQQIHEFIIHCLQE